MSTIEKCKSCKYATTHLWTIKCTLNPYNCIVDGKFKLYKPKELK